MGVHAGVWVCATEWVGVHDIPLIASSRVRSNIQMVGEGGIVSAADRAKKACLAVHADVATDDATTHAILLGRDGWVYFPIRKYVYINEERTIVSIYRARTKKCLKC